jgi:hypothetical protein
LQVIIWLHVPSSKSLGCNSNLSDLRCRVSTRPHPFEWVLSTANHISQRSFKAQNIYTDNSAMVAMFVLDMLAILWIAKVLPSNVAYTATMGGLTFRRTVTQPVCTWFHNSSNALPITGRKAGRILKVEYLRLGSSLLPCCCIHQFVAKARNQTSAKKSGLIFLYKCACGWRSTNLDYD